MAKKARAASSAGELESLRRQVAQLQQQEKRLAESEERFRTMFENSPDGLLLVEAATGRFRMANKAICGMTGYTAEEIAQRSIPDIHPQECRDRVLRDFADGLQGKLDLVQNLPVQTKDGRVLYMDIRSMQMTLDGVRYVMGVFRDVTQRRQLVQRLQESEERYRVLVENAEESIAVVDQEGRFLFLNTPAAARLGGRPDDYTGRTMWELFPRPIADRQMGSIRKVIETGQGMNVIVPTDLRGVMRWHNTTIEPLSEGDGSVRTALVVARDIHELRQAQKELEEYRSHMAGAERLASLGTLSATIAHEMNQPLTVLRLTLQDCLAQLEQGGSASGMAGDLRDCLEEVATAAAIVDRFKSFARHSSRRKSGRTNLQRTAERVARLWEDAAGRQHLRIVLEGLDRLGEIDADAGDMEQVFFSLLENAVQAADGARSHRLLVRGVACEGGVALHFSDDCGGIAPEHVGRIFEPFFTTKSHDQGTGLGLCIVEQALTRAGGRIRVENRPGEGVTFVVTLPRKSKQT